MRSRARCRSSATANPASQVWKLLGLLAGLALLFMLLPTVNLININISRIMERASEIGVRKAFGAPARTLVGQFIVENIILTLVGGLVGFVLSFFCLRSSSGAASSSTRTSRSTRGSSSTAWRSRCCSA